MGQVKPGQLVSDEEIERQFCQPGCTDIHIGIVRWAESLVRRRLAERLRAAKTDGGELAARVVESDD